MFHVSLPYFLSTNTDVYTSKTGMYILYGMQSMISRADKTFWHNREHFFFFFTFLIPIRLGQLLCWVYILEKTWENVTIIIQWYNNLTQWRWLVSAVYFFISQSLKMTFMLLISYSAELLAVFTDINIIIYK